MPRKIFIKTANTLNLLKEVYLGGVINEAIITLEKGKASIEAVDITASIVYISSASVSTKKLNGELGLGNIELFIKFLSTMKDPKLSIALTENRMIVSRKDKRRKLEYLLSQPALIPTRLRMNDDDDNDPRDAFESMAETKAELDESFVKDFSSYIATLKTKIVTIDVDADNATFTLGPKSEHQFKLSLPITEDPTDDDFTLKVNGDYLSKILSVLEFNEDDDPITIGFSDGKPIIIEAAPSLWAVSPSEELEED